MKRYFIVLAALVLMFSCSERSIKRIPKQGGTESEVYSLPHLIKDGEATHLMVKDKPFLILGGELHNSSSSNPEYLYPLWWPLEKMNLNTVLAAVSWELTEPEEGKFDFTLVDSILKQAREHHMKLILLWFGSWKNGLSHYAPEWVKKDYKRFSRVILENGKPIETISALSSEAMNADAKAFSALMGHLKEVDGKEQTVIMIQVENEVGVIGSARDYSEMGNIEFQKPVPAELTHLLFSGSKELQPVLKKKWEAAGSKTEGCWTDIFGKTAFADEAFMAWHYALYINSVASAGKAVYNIPMYVNAWIVQPTDKKPGDYPSGGPQAHVHDIWKAAAPSIDILAPDIYLSDFPGITAIYHHDDNPLFVPESFAGQAGAANAFYTIGQHSGIGYSPFGIDSKLDEPSLTPIAKAYKLLSQLSGLILEAQSKGTIAAVQLDETDSAKTVTMGGYKLLVTIRKNWRGVNQADNGYGLIIHSDKDEFIVAGSNLNIVFVPDSPGPRMAGLLSVNEGEYIDGKWEAGRLLNGDDIMISYDLAGETIAQRTGTGAKLGNEPCILHIKLYRFE